MVSMPQATLLPECHRCHSAGRRAVKCRVQWQQVWSVESKWSQPRARTHGSGCEWPLGTSGHTELARSQQVAGGRQPPGLRKMDQGTRTGSGHRLLGPQGQPQGPEPLAALSVPSRCGRTRRCRWEGGVPVNPNPLWHFGLSAGCSSHTVASPSLHPDCSQSCRCPQPPTCPTSLG